MRKLLQSHPYIRDLNTNGDPDERIAGCHVTEERERFHATGRRERTRVLRVGMPTAYGGSPLVLAWKSDEGRAPVFRRLVDLAGKDGIDGRQHASTAKLTESRVILQVLQMGRAFRRPGCRFVSVNASVSEHMPNGLAHRRSRLGGNGPRQTRPAVRVKLLDQFHF
jgi:hypothetical protein